MNKTMIVLDQEVIVIPCLGCDPCVFYERDKIDATKTNHCRLFTQAGLYLLCLSTEARALTGGPGAAFVTIEKYAEMRIKGQL